MFQNLHVTVNFNESFDRDKMFLYPTTSAVYYIHIAYTVVSLDISNAWFFESLDFSQTLKN